MKPAILAAAFVPLVMIAGCGGRQAASPRPAPAVTTAPAQVRRVEVTIPFLGRVEAARQVRLVALAEGTVTAIPVADGAAVAAGDTVFRIGGARATARLQALEADVDARRHALDAARDRLAQARRRQKAHLAAPGEVTAAETAADRAEAALAAATAALRRFHAALVVVAPTAGRFVGRRVSVGQAVGVGDTLGEILAPESLRVAAAVPATADRQPRSGERAEITRESGGPIPLRVVAVRPLADAAGSVQVWLEGPGLAALQPGTAVRGRIVTAVHEKAVTVPPSAVVRDRHDRPLVYTGAKAPFARREVTTGETGPGWIEITSGLAAGEPVVVRGAYELYWAAFAKEFKVED